VRLRSASAPSPRRYLPLTSSPHTRSLSGGSQGRAPPSSGCFLLPSIYLPSSRGLSLRLTTLSCIP
jgi:hypothetical protein